MYLFLVILFTQDSAVIIQALIRAVIFIGIAGVTAFLSVKLSLAEKGLGESEKKFKNILERIPLPVVYVSKDGNIIFRNERFIKMFGYTAKEVPTISEWWMNAYPDPQYRQWVMQTWSSAVEHAEETDADIEPRDIKITCKDGSVREITISGILISDDLLAAFIDVTERKNIEKALKENQEKYQGLVETLYDWVWEVDLNGRYTYVSPQVKSILGFEPEEVIGKTPFDLMVPEEKMRVAEKFNQLIREQKPIISLENVNFDKNRRPVVLETNGLPFYDADGYVKGYRGTDRNITERKNIEYQLKERIKELQAFYNLAKITDKINISVGEILQEFINIIPQSWQHVDSCCARLIINGSEYRTNNFKESAWMQYSPIKVRGSNTGKIEVGYLDKMPDEDEGPFLKEERLLLNAVAERLGHIIERRQAEEELQLNANRLSILVEILQRPSESLHEYLDYALEKAIEITNSKIGYIYFYSEKKKEFVLNTWSRDVMKECTIADKQRVYQLDKTGIWGEAVRQRKPILVNDFQSPNPFQKGYPEGHAHLKKFLTIPIFDANEIIAVVGVANKATDYSENDVSQLTVFMEIVWKVVARMRAEEESRKNADVIQLLLNSTAEAIYGLDVNGLCTFNNEACLRILGYERHDELLGKNMHDMIHSKHADGTPYDVHECPIFKAFNKGERAHIDNEVLWKKDGTSFNAEYWSYPIIKDNEIIGAVVTFLDITDKKKAEEELHKLSLATEQSPASIVITDTKGAIEYVNPTFIQITGYSFREVLGKNPRILKSGETPAGEYAKLWNIITSGGEWRGEFHNKKKNGELYWESAVISPIINEYGHTTHFLAVKEDITKRKHAEQALQVSITEREKLIKELQLALENVKTLQGLIPICANCKKIRDDQGYWNQVEGYLMEHTDAKFSHGLCPDCGKKLYGDLYDNAVKKDEVRKADRNSKNNGGTKNE